MRSAYLRSRAVSSRVFLLLAGLSLGLVGCQADVETELDVSDFRTPETRGLFATVQVRTDDCDRGARSTQREGSLGWTNWVLSGVFPDTRYRACSTAGERSEATFRNMIVLDAQPGESLSGLSHVNLKLHERTLYAGLPPYVQGNIQRVRGQVGIPSGPEITSHLVLINNSDTAFGYRVARYDAADEIGWSDQRVVPSRERVRLTFPPAMAEQVLEDGRAPLLRYR
ncbi:hypothetical protein P8631_06210 [Guyparkeria sp. 1SP6A2]|nr:hypothetical protein [Guyparkeria sp. 1SP6A2]